MRLDAVGTPATTSIKFLVLLMPPHELQVITVADCKNLPKRLDDTVEEGKAGW